MNPRMQNGKNADRFNSRKHMNTKPKHYKHMDQSVENVANGKANNVLLQGARLQNILTKYNIQFKPGTKGLGRTHAVLVMYNTPQGPAAMITRK